MNLTRRGLVAGLAAVAPLASVCPAAAASDPELDRAAAAALRRLTASNQAARLLNDKAVAVLVFPKIVKVGFLLGGAYGEGARCGRAAGRLATIIRRRRRTACRPGRNGSATRCSS